MLKKVMIICLALSFVFFGGIGIALAADHIGPPTEPPMAPRGDQDGSCQDYTDTTALLLASRSNPGSKYN